MHPCTRSPHKRWIRGRTPFSAHWFLYRLRSHISRVEGGVQNTSSSQLVPTGIYKASCTSKDLGMIPLSSGGSGYPSMVWVFPAPVWNSS